MVEKVGNEVKESNQISWEDTLKSFIPDSDNPDNQTLEKALTAVAQIQEGYLGLQQLLNPEGYRLVVTRVLNQSTPIIPTEHTEIPDTYRRTAYFQSFRDDPRIEMYIESRKRWEGRDVEDYPKW